MAPRSSKTNGRTNGAVPRSRPGLDARVVAAQAEQVATAVTALARITEDVSEQAETQVRSLDGTLSGLNEMAASLKETAGRADAVGST
ncbi:MAG TPA: hypothetical protein VE505_14235, partial [Vicinamibacterales bacterium]|nr:hypothetical protein [Vicinamibacterales bacterium]